MSWRLCKDFTLFAHSFILYCFYRCVGHEQADSCVGVDNSYVLHFALTILCILKLNIQLMKINFITKNANDYGCQ